MSAAAAAMGAGLCGCLVDPLHLDVAKIFAGQTSHQNHGKGREEGHLALSPAA